MRNSANKESLKVSSPGQVKNDANKNCHPSTPSSHGAILGEIHLGTGAGCGCLCFLALYYIVGIAQLGDINWKTEWWYVPAYAFGPLLWPIIIGWWSGNGLLQTTLAICGLLFYVRLLRQLFLPKSIRAFWGAIIGLVLLFLISIGGCMAMFSRGMDGVC